MTSVAGWVTVGVITVAMRALSGLLLRAWAWRTQLRRWETTVTAVPVAMPNAIPTQAPAVSLPSTVQPLHQYLRLRKLRHGVRLGAVDWAARAAALAGPGATASAGAATSSGISPAVCPRVRDDVAAGVDGSQRDRDRRGGVDGRERGATRAAIAVGVVAVCLHAVRARPYRGGVSAPLYRGRACAPLCRPGSL